MKKQEKKSAGTSLQSTLHIGKGGIDGAVEELKIQLRKKKLVKVRFLRTAFVETGKRELAQKLADLSHSTLVEMRGNTAVFTS